MTDACARESALRKARAHGHGNLCKSSEGAHSSLVCVSWSLYVDSAVLQASCKVAMCILAWKVVPLAGMWREAWHVCSRDKQSIASCVPLQEYSRQLHANRWNIFWRDEPPRNSCVMPHDNLPWSPELSHW